MKFKYLPAVLALNAVAYGATYQYVADVPILSWSTNGASTSFIQIDSTAITGSPKPCHLGWIRVADNSQLSLILSAVDQSRQVNHMTIRTDTSVYTIPPTTSNTSSCVVEYVEFAID